MILFNDDDVLRTERLLLRPLRPDDAAPLFALFNNWNVMRFLSSPPWPYTLDDARWFIRSAITHAAELNEEALAITRDGLFIGVIACASVKQMPCSAAPVPTSATGSASRSGAAAS